MFRLPGFMALHMRGICRRGPMPGIGFRSSASCCPVDSVIVCRVHLSSRSGLGFRFDITSQVATASAMPAKLPATHVFHLGPCAAFGSWGSACPKEFHRARYERRRSPAAADARSSSNSDARVLPHVEASPEPSKRQWFGTNHRGQCSERRPAANGHRAGQHLVEDEPEPRYRSSTSTVCRQGLFRRRS